MNKFAHGLPKDLYKGMRVRPSMDMVVNYIEKDPYKITYPNRDATFYLNSPQFLNLLNDSGLDLDEQSKNLAKQQLVQSQARARGLGGAVDIATGSDTDFYIGSRRPSHDSQDLGGDGMSEGSHGSSAYRRRVQEAIRITQEQERVRQENEDYIRRQQEALDQANEAKRRKAVELASQSAAAASSHPVASASASAAFAPSLLIGSRDVIYTPTPDAPFASQLKPSPKLDQSMQEKVQTKRTSEGQVGSASPKAKARASTPPPQQTASASSATGSRVRGVSIDPQNKYIEAAADAKKLSLDPALRSDEAHLKSLRAPVLRELLKLEGYPHINIPTIGKTNVDKASKPDLIAAIMRHYSKGKGKGKQ